MTVDFYTIAAPPFVPRWSGGYNVQQMPWGEYERGSGWTFAKTLDPWARSYRRRELRLRVFPVKSYGRGRWRLAWSLDAEHGPTRMHVASGRASSLRACRAAADGAWTGEHEARLWREAHSADMSVRLHDWSGTPIMSLLGTNWHMNEVPSGSWVGVDSEGRFRHYDAWGSGVSSAGLTHPIRWCTENRS